MIYGHFVVIMQILNFMFVSQYPNESNISLKR